MHPRPLSARRGLVATTVLGLLAALLTVAGLGVSPARANPGGTDLVISEVYAAGSSNNVAYYNADYVELYNPTDATISLVGRSLQYRASGTTAATVVALAGAVPAQSHYLVQMSAAGPNGAELPPPNLVSSPAIDMNGGAGQVFLATSTTPFETTGNVAGNTALVDMVGYGSAGTYEGAPTGVGLGVPGAGLPAPAAFRNATGSDTNINEADFTEGPADPQAFEVSSSSVSGSAAPFVYGTTGTVTATVSPAAATGTVSLYDGATLIGEGSLSGGTTDITITAGTLEPGTTSVELRYSGDAAYASSTGSVSVQVLKAMPTVVATATPDSVAINTGETAVGVTVTAPGFTPTGTVQAWVDGAMEGSATLSAGTATITGVGPFDALGATDIEVRYLGDTHADTATDTVSVAVVAASATVTATPTPTSVKVKQGTISMGVTVTATGVTPTGAVEAWVDGVLEGSGTLSAGTATITGIGPFDAVGATDIEVHYLGDAHVAAATDAVTVQVVKVTPRMRVTKSPKRVQVRATKPVVKVTVEAAGFTVTGKVKVQVGGKEFTTRLTAGAARFVLPRFTSVGVKRVRVLYLGSALTNGTDKTLRIRVVR